MCRNQDRTFSFYVKLLSVVYKIRIHMLKYMQNSLKKVFVYVDLKIVILISCAEQLDIYS